MNGSIFKRRLPSGTVSWCYSFIAGKDEKGKRIVNFKGGNETRGAAGEALRDAIKEYEKAHGKITKRRGVLGGIIWGYEFGDDRKSGFSDQQAATVALAEAVQRRAATEEAEAKAQLKIDPSLGEFIDTWLKVMRLARWHPKRWRGITTSPPTSNTTWARYASTI